MAGRGTIIPGQLLVAVAAGWTVLGAVAAWRAGLVPLWGWAGAAAGLAALADAAWVLLLERPAFERRLPGRFAVGEPTEVVVRLDNRSGRAARVAVADGVPATAEAAELPLELRVPARRRGEARYRVTQLQRGEVRFAPAQLRLRSPLGLWWRGWRAGAPEDVRVYPDFAPVIRLALLAMEHRVDPAGVRRRGRGGVSREFHQLRDFQEGDSLAQVDWKATSRHRHLISREFEEQRNQTIVLLLDTGRRMRAVDGRLPQFDHCLNASLLLGCVALRQGDLVGVQGFGGTDRWLPPQRGAGAVATLLNHLYDYQTTAQPSDFTAAAERLMERQRRRALVVLLTNLRGEDEAELLPALRMLRSRHLVVLGSLREQAVDALRREPVAGFREALRFAAAEAYFAERRAVLRGLERAGVLTVDVAAAEFPVALANRYLEIKRAARL